MDRRTFLQRALLTMTPVVSIVAPFLSNHSANSDAVQPSSLPVDTNAGLSSVVFTIEGWDQFASGASRDHSGEDQVFIRINQSWCCAWR
jgi:hypothetical protein